AGEIILDPFLGSGTAAIEACRLDRRCLGVDLSAELINRLRVKLASEVARGRVALVQGDSGSEETLERVRAQLAAWDAERAQLLVLHPPYHDIIRFTDQPEDLCNAPSVDAFVARFTAI